MIVAALLGALALAVFVAGLARMARDEQQQARDAENRPVTPSDAPSWRR